MKYLVFKYSNTQLAQLERVYLFPEDVQHKDFAALMPKEWTAIRGGMVTVWANEDTLVFNVFGEAFSLGLRGDKEKDRALIRHHLEQ